MWVVSRLTAGESAAATYMVSKPHAHSSMAIPDRTKAIASWSVVAGVVIFLVGFVGILLYNGLCPESCDVWNSIVPYLVIATVGLLVLAVAAVLQWIRGRTWIAVTLLLAVAFSVGVIDWVGALLGVGNPLPTWAVLLPVLVSVGMSVARSGLRPRAKTS